MNYRLIFGFVVASSLCFPCVNTLIAESPEFNKSLREEQEALLRTFNRLKDIVHFEGIRENILVGYGLVVGLNGSGDNLKNSVFTQQELENFLGKLGVNSRGANIKTKNVAAVMLTAKLPPFARQGNKIDVTASALGDAKDLGGGVLIASPLMGADGSVYALAQGHISTGGVEVKPGSTGKSKAVSTTGFIPDGAIVEKEIDFSLNSMKTINMSLINPDISTAYEIVKEVNILLEENVARALDPSTVSLVVPVSYYGNVLNLLARIENIRVKSDNSAKIIIDESSGTVVMGDNVRVDPVAIAQNNLVLEVRNTKYGAGGKKPPGSEIAILERSTSLKDLVAGLNALGVSTRDLIDILHNIKRAGALSAEIIVK